MPFAKATEDATFKCSQCGHLIPVKEGQIVPPCTRCGGTMERTREAPPRSNAPGPECT